MSAPAPGLGDFSYLGPLFDAAAVHRADDHFVPPPEPAVGSSLAQDDEPLKSWGVANFVRSSLTAGLFHVEALNKLVTVVRKVDPYSPWTLLRCVLENFATAVWLLEGQTCDGRRHRALSLWDEDFRNRAQHEADVHHVVTGPDEKTGEQRRQEVKQLADNLGLCPLSTPRAGEIIVTAASTAGLDPEQTRASWRVASGFAHGRFWPHLRAAEPTGVVSTPGGRLISFQVDDKQLESLATACRTLLEHTARQYASRSTPP
ncbi:hypothetical protein ACFWY6_21175 [Streptomyces sp. NPDC059037]|uniref:hypothetical protein n=1 Tax=Streptomyces sp. NPDC059037 TaxID=3346710 RepID=UPI00369926DB